MATACRADWLSFTMDTGIATPLPFPIFAVRLQQETTQLIPYSSCPDVPLLQWTRRKSRHPYSVTYVDADAGMSIYAHPNSPRILVEMTGRCCERLYNSNTLTTLLTSVRGSVTRIDLAVDFETDVRPVEFADARDVQRFRAAGHFISETGETVYVGSQKSDRYTRVYRYEPPHPRAALLRCEMVFRKEAARAAVDVLLASGERVAARDAGACYGWTHSLWTDDFASGEAIAAFRPERRSGKTLRWVLAQVVPALARLANEGVIEDLDAFWQQHLFPLLDRAKMNPDEFTSIDHKGDE